MSNPVRILLTASCLTFSAMALPTPSIAEEVTVTLSVPDMNCPACPITVRKSIERVDGVVRAQAFIETRTAVVTFDDSKTDVSALTEATGNYGYPSTLIETGSEG